jgi:uncharacterized ion transporter superfamily protein YfcC
MAWFGLAKMAFQAGSHIYKKRQETKMAMADAQHMHAQRMARGEESYQGKLLESRDNDYKDEIVLAILTLPIIVLAYGVWSNDPGAMEKINIFFEHFSNLPKWFTNLWILVVASVFGIKGTLAGRLGAAARPIARTLGYKKGERVYKKGGSAK